MADPHADAAQLEHVRSELDVLRTELADLAEIDEHLEQYLRARGIHVTHTASGDIVATQGGRPILWAGPPAGEWWT